MNRFERITRRVFTTGAVAASIALGGPVLAEGDAAMDAALQRHFANETQAAKQGQQASPAKAGDPRESADAMVAYFAQPQPVDVTVASRRHLDLDIKFAFDSAEISEDGKAQLDVAGQALNNPQLANRRFMLAGHTDDRGEANYNKALSLRRAQAARQYLIDKYDVEPDRLGTAGFGSEHPRATENTAEARTKNRRVVLEMVQ